MFKSSLHGGGSIEARKRDHKLAEEAKKSVAMHSRGDTHGDSSGHASAPGGEADTAAHHAAKYKACGWACVEAIARAYEPDFDLFGWPSPDQAAERLPGLGARV